MLKKILLVLFVVIVGVLGYAVTRPDYFRVERVAHIKAPAAKIYPLIADFKNWPQWSPWEKLDPNMHRTIAGAPRGKGATYGWKGNSDVGEGRMEITDTTEPTQIEIKLDFISPMEGHNTTRFRLDPEGDGTRVTWTMQGPAPFLHKLMGVFMNIDQMIGKDFERGLASLKAVAEK